MPSINKCFILSSLALSALTLATPHGLRNVGQPGATAEGLLARVPEPTPVVVPIFAAKPVRRRGNDDCKSPDSTSTPNVAAPKASPKATPRSSSMTPAPSGGRSPSSASSSSSGTHTGEGTYYATGLGACGVTNKDSQYIVAVSELLFDSYPGYNGANSNKNPICGKKVTAHYKGKSVTCTIVDRCVGCAHDDLDFSPAAFSVLANQDVGRIYGVTWDYD